MNQAQCETCRFWSRHDENSDWGDCHLNLERVGMTPHLMFYASHENIIITTRNVFGCIVHEPKDTE